MEYQMKKKWKTETGFMPGLLLGNKRLRGLRICSRLGFWDLGFGFKNSA